MRRSSELNLCILKSLTVAMNNWIASEERKEEVATFERLQKQAPMFTSL